MKLFNKSKNKVKSPTKTICLNVKRKKGVNKQNLDDVISFALREIDMANSKNYCECPECV